MSGRGIRMTAPSSGALAVVAAAALWGTTGTAQTFAPDDTPALAVGFVRLAIGGAALAAIAGPAAVRLVRSQRGRPLPMAGAAVAMAAYQPLFFEGVDRTGVAIGTIVAIGSAPVLAGVLARVVRAERLTPRWAAATSLAVAGAALLVAGGADIGVDASGVVLALGAGAAYAVYAVAAKVLLDHHPPLPVMGAVFATAAMLSLPVVLLS